MLLFNSRHCSRLQSIAAHKSIGHVCTAHRPINCSWSWSHASVYINIIFDIYYIVKYCAGGILLHKPWNIIHIIDASEQLKRHGWTERCWTETRQRGLWISNINCMNETNSIFTLKNLVCLREGNSHLDAIQHSLVNREFRVIIKFQYVYFHSSFRCHSGWIQVCAGNIVCASKHLSTTLNVRH